MTDSQIEQLIAQIIKQAQEAQQSIQLAQATAEPEQIRQALLQVEVAEQQLQSIQATSGNNIQQDAQYHQAEQQVQHARLRAEQTERAQQNKYE